MAHVEYSGRVGSAAATYNEFEIFIVGGKCIFIECSLEEATERACTLMILLSHEARLKLSKYQHVRVQRTLNLKPLTFKLDTHWFCFTGDLLRAF